MSTSEPVWSRSAIPNTTGHGWSRYTKQPSPHSTPTRPNATVSARRSGRTRSSTGTRLTPSGVAQTLRPITTAIGIRDATTRPTAHQLRHSFAVRTLIDWQQSGVSVDGHIATLSTYLGHIAPSDTYWYLSASPELMDIAAERLDTRFGART